MNMERTRYRGIPRGNKREDDNKGMINRSIRGICSAGNKEFDSDRGYRMITRAEESRRDGIIGSARSHRGKEYVSR